MSSAYRLLQEGLEPRGTAKGLDVPLDAKRALGWVESLPRANQAATLRMLMGALSGLAGVRLEGAQRLGLMEVLRAPIMEMMNALKQQAQGGTVPLAAAKARAIDQLVYFEHALAEAYRLAAIEQCAPSGGVPFLRGGAVATALVRALYHAARTFNHAYFVYQSPPAGRWALMHRLFLFARSVKLQDKAVEEPNEPQPLTAEGLYMQTCLLALSNPYRFSQKEQEDLWRVSADLASHLHLREQHGSGHVFGIPNDADDGPGYVPEERVDAGASMLWLDLTPLRDLLEMPLSGGAAGPVLVRGGRGGRSISSTVELLRRLRGGWGTSATRRNQRLGATHQLRSVIGLAGLHFHLSSRHDFEGFLQQAGAKDAQQDRRRAGWTHGGVDSGRIPVHLTEILDQSLGGYRVRWPNEEAVRARVGELVGLSEDADEDGTTWMLASIRWLRYDPDGTVYAGLELLSRRTRAVALRPPGKDASAKAPQRAIQYEPVRDLVDGSIHLAIGGGIESSEGEAEVVRVAEPRDLEVPEPTRETLRSAHLIEVSGDYLLTRFERITA